MYLYTWMKNASYLSNHGSDAYIVQDLNDVQEVYVVQQK